MKTRGVRRGWKWRQNTDRIRHALEDDKYDRNKADKGRTEAADNSGRETAALRVRAGSLDRPLSGIRLPSRPSHFFGGGVAGSGGNGLASKEEAASGEEVKVEDRCRFFRPCIWINCPFTCLGVWSVGLVAVAVAALEVKDGCVPGGAVVGGEVRIGGVRHHRHTGLVRRSGGDAVICFCMPV